MKVHVIEVDSATLFIQNTWTRNLDDNFRMRCMNNIKNMQMLKSKEEEMDILTTTIFAMTISTNAQEVVVTVVVEIGKDVGIRKKIEAADEEKVGNVQMMIVMTEIMID